MKCIVSIVFLFVITLCACKNESYPSTPEAVVKKYLAEANNGKPGSTLPYTTKSSEQMIKMIESHPQERKDSDTSGMEIRTAKIVDDKAIVPMFNKKTKTPTYFVLRKEDDRWKVDMSKEGLMETSKLGLEHFGINIDDLRSGKISQDSAKKIIDAYMKEHPDGE